jgi:hypothetical protein
MPGNLVDAEEIRLLDLSLPTGAGAITLKLRSTAPTESADGTAIVAGNYADQNFAVSAAPGKANLADILFPAATVAYTVLGYDIYVGASRRWYLALAAPDQRTVNPGDQYKIAAGALTFGGD